MLKILLQGFLIGMAKMIPGFSGSLLAISFGVYEKALDIIGNLRRIDKNRILYLLFLGMGIIIGIIVFSYVVKFLLKAFYFPIMLLFIGLIVGSIQDLLKDIKGYSHPLIGLCFFTFSFLIVIFLSTYKIVNNNYFTNIFLYLPLGIIESITTLIPGISGTAVYMIFGVYDLILELYINTFEISNFLTLLLYFMGFGIGVLLLAKILNFILKRYKKILYITILGFMTSAVFILTMQILSYPFNLLDLFIGILLLIIGYFIAYKLNHLF